MDVLLDVVYLVLGVGLLYGGAEWMVGGSSRLARSFGVSPILVGLTVVAFGTSAPELAVSLAAALDNASGIAVGNVIGSNIANVALVLGLAALIRPIRFEQSVMRRELPIMLAACGLMALLCLDGELSRGDGALLSAGMVAFMSWVFFEVKKGRQVQMEGMDEEGGNAPAAKGETRDWVHTIVGIIGIVGGARLLVLGAVSLARAAGLSEVVIGITMVAVGTSLPELAASVVAAAKGEGAVSLGNVVGSNIFNVLLILGIVSLVSPLQVEAQSIRVDLPVMLGFCVCVVPLALLAPRFHVGRRRGALLLLGYTVYMVSLFALR